MATSDRVEGWRKLIRMFAVGEVLWIALFGIGLALHVRLYALIAVVMFVVDLGFLVIFAVMLRSERQKAGG